MSSDYRREIDGLRALAVGAVLLFHADVPGFDGGYLGVDVFFVISGFLITRIVLDDVSAGSFSFRAFYLRRLRRLAPALLVTIGGTIIAGAALMTPEHMRGLGASAAAASFYLSNLFFWSEAGYFDASASIKPLLHTWSLAVEEQFYLVWPLLLAGLWRFARPLVWPAIFASGLVALFAAEARIGLHPAEVFFHFAYRISEFAIGASAIIAVRAKDVLTPNVREALTIIGLAAICAPVLAYESSTRVPGLAALPPALGAAAIIIGGETRAARVPLQNPVSVFIGRISYSLYLVHWPVVVFYKYAFGDALSPADRIIILALSIALGWASWRFVETPFRRPGARNSLFAGITLAAMTVTAGAGAHAWRTNGWPWRYDADIAGIAAELPAMKDALFARSIAAEAAPFPAKGKVNAVILGDSHGANLLNALTLAGARANFRHVHIQWMCGLYLGPRTVTPGSPVPTPEEAARCETQAEQMRDSALLAAADVIVISSTWTDEARARFPALLDYLRSAYRAEIVLLGPRYYFIDPNDVLKTFDTFEAADATFSAAKNEKAFEETKADLELAAAAAGVPFIDIQPALCDAGPPVRCPLFAETREILYFDWHHWSPAGERRAGEALKRNGRLGRLF